MSEHACSFFQSRLSKNPREIIEETVSKAEKNIRANEWRQ